MKTRQLIKTIAALQLKTNYEVEKIPAFITKTLSCWTNGKWSIANPEPESDTITRTPLPVRTVADTTLREVTLTRGYDEVNPGRQLMYLGLNEHYMLIAYEAGSLCWRLTPVMLFRFENKKVISVLFWYGICAGKKTKEEVLTTLKFLEPYLTLAL